jgi:hypothetical protein
MLAVKARFDGKSVVLPEVPRHPAGQGQHVHLDPVLVHPFASFVQIEAERIRTATPSSMPQPGHGLVIGLWRPVRVHVDRNWTSFYTFHDRSPSSKVLLKELTANQHCLRFSQILF